MMIILCGFITMNDTFLIHIVICPVVDIEILMNAALKLFYTESEYKLCVHKNVKTVCIPSPRQKLFYFVFLWSALESSNSDRNDDSLLFMILNKKQEKVLCLPNLGKAMIDGGVSTTGSYSL